MTRAASYDLYFTFFSEPYAQLVRKGFDLTSMDGKLGSVRLEVRKKHMGESGALRLGPHNIYWPFGLVFGLKSDTSVPLLRKPKNNGYGQNFLTQVRSTLVSFIFRPVDLNITKWTT